MRIRFRFLVSAFVAVFLVAIFPACWFGALARAVADSTEQPSNANNNEEHEKEEPGDGEGIVQAFGSKLPQPHQRVVDSPARSKRWQRPERIRDHLVLDPHAREISARRLI